MICKNCHRKLATLTKKDGATVFIHSTPTPLCANPEPLV